MTHPSNSDKHDEYAADYDDQVQLYGCHITDVLFGLCYEYLLPSQSLLDAGIGSGLSSAQFSKAGIKIFGMDFSAAMLEICREKGFAVELKQHDIQQIPWPYVSSTFDHLVCCGVLHFVADPEPVFLEARRLLRNGGILAFTSRVASSPMEHHQRFISQVVGGFDIFSHAPDYIESFLENSSFWLRKKQKCFVGEDVFLTWIFQKKDQHK